MFIPCYVYPFVHGWVAPHLLTIMNNTAKNMSVQISAWILAFSYFAIDLEVEFLNYMLILCLSFLGSHILFSWWLSW